VEYPIIADDKREIVALYGMIDPEEKNAEGLPMTCRGQIKIANNHLTLIQPYSSLGQTRS